MSMQESGEARSAVAGYAFSNNWEHERERLARIEKVWDPLTVASLERTGIQVGWHCLEVGAGAGSIAKWLSDRVGLEGCVVATDINPHLLDRLGRLNVEAAKHDIRCDPIAPESFDLIHARLLLEHLAERDNVLDKMVAAVKPGGWLAVDDSDWVSMCSVHHEPMFGDMVKTVAQFLGRAGHDAFYGRRLETAFAKRRLVDVEVRTRVNYLRPGDPQLVAFAMAFAQLRPALVESRLVSEEDVEAIDRLVQDADFRALSHVMFSVTGRKVR